MYHQEDLLKAIVSTSSDIYVVSDEYGKIILGNKKLEEVTGLSLKEIIGTDVSKIFSFPEGIKIQSVEDKLHSNLQAIIIHRKDKQKITLSGKLFELRHALKKNKFCGYIYIIYTGLNLNSVEQAQMEFVSTVSHELRTPLTSIRGFAETLLRSWEKLAEEIKKRYITVIKEQSDRLTRLVEDLLAVSRLESQSFDLDVREIDISKAIAKVCDALSSKSLKHTIVTKIEKPIPNVKADADRLEQILTNLIDNAIKYSPGGGEVTISVSSILNEQNIKHRLKIEISDQGIGIKESDLSKIFTKFGRVDNPMTRQTQGTGLGLFITKSLVLALKGEIFVSSVPNKTTFSVILPASIPQAPIQLSASSSVNLDKRQVE